MLGLPLTLAGPKLRRDKLLRYAPCPLWGNVVALFFSPGEYLGAKVFENTFFSPLASSKSPFHKHFHCIDSHLGRATPFQGFRKTSFQENIFVTIFPGLPTYSPNSSSENGDKDDKVVSTISLVERCSVGINEGCTLMVD
jgi:hypothetical protein